MHVALVLGDDIISQLIHGIFSWQFLQFLIAFVSYFGFVMTSAIILILAERKVLGWMQDRFGPIHVGRLGLQQQILVDGWTTFGGADDLLRAATGAGLSRGDHAHQRAGRQPWLSRIQEWYWHYLYQRD